MPHLNALRLAVLALALAAPTVTAQIVDAPTARPDDAGASSSRGISVPTGTSAATVAYQGTLSDGGAPVADGSYTVTVGLFGAATGGTTLYAETHIVTTVGGAFSLAIGGGTPTVGAYGTVRFDTETWVEVGVDGTTLGPRTLLQAVPHARSLTAGAEIRGSIENASALRVTNTASSNGTSITGFSNANVNGVGVEGVAVANTGIAYGVFGLSLSPTGRGVYGKISSASGTGAGVYGESGSPDGRGVYGDATAASGTTYGVYGTSASTAGRGVYGLAGAATGLAYGVYGQSQSTNGVGAFGNAPATSGTTFGVFGRSQSPGGRGVYGLTTATSGTTYGVHGQSQSPDGRGVYGLAAASSGTSSGLYGQSESPDGRGVYGLANATSGDAIGVYGRSEGPDGTGVFGLSAAGSGTTRAVSGFVVSPTGYAGYFEGGRGIYVDADGLTGHGATIQNSGGSGISTATVFAENTSTGSGIAGWFESNGTDATMVVDQEGSGDILRGFSSGNLRFRVENDGDVRADGTFTGGGADLAEFFPLEDGATVVPGQVVGLRGGRVSLATDGAEQIAVISSNPAFVGNPDAEAGGALVALVGQVAVAVSGEAAAGDVLIASGAADGRARAVSPERYSPADGAVLGRVLTVEDGRVVALVGVDEAAALRDVVARQADRLDRQAAQIEALAERLARLEAHLAPAP